jgi:CRP-like cAMP-binding protein
MKELEAFQAYLTKLAVIPPDALADMITFAAPRVAHLARRDTFVRQGDEAKHIAFVLDGLFKVFITSTRGKTYIKRFVREGELVGPYHAFITGKPATVSVQALEPARVVMLRADKLRALFGRHACWQEVGRKIAERYFCEREVDELERVMLSAEARYRKLVREDAALVGRVSQGDIARFIGISPVSLSRIRRRIAGAKANR